MKTKEILMKSISNTQTQHTNLKGYLGMLLIGFSIIDFAMS